MNLFIYECKVKCHKKHGLFDSCPNIVVNSPKRIPLIFFNPFFSEAAEDFSVMPSSRDGYLMRFLIAGSLRDNDFLEAMFIIFHSVYHCHHVICFFFTVFIVNGFEKKGWRGAAINITHEELRMPLCLTPEQWNQPVEASKQKKHFTFHNTPYHHIVSFQRVNFWKGSTTTTASSSRYFFWPSRTSVSSSEHGKKRWVGGGGRSFGFQISFSEELAWKRCAAISHERGPDTIIQGTAYDIKLAGIQLRARCLSWLRFKWPRATYGAFR